jgi:hypothetical protein
MLLPKGRTKTYLAAFLVKCRLYTSTPVATPNVPTGILEELDFQTLKRGFLLPEAQMDNKVGEHEIDHVLWVNM